MVYVVDFSLIIMVAAGLVAFVMWFCVGDLLGFGF